MYRTLISRFGYLLGSSFKFFRVKIVKFIILLFNRQVKLPVCKENDILNAIYNVQFNIDIYSYQYLWIEIIHLKYINLQ